MPAETAYCTYCDHDAHRCKGCGEPLLHGTEVCAKCKSEHTRPVELDPATAAWRQAALTAKAEIARLTEIYDRATEHIQNALGDAQQATIGGKPAISWAWSKPSPYIDKKALETDLPDVAARYTKFKKPARPFKILDGDQ
jgi:hypothetical protein